LVRPSTSEKHFSPCDLTPSAFAGSGRISYVGGVRQEIGDIVVRTGGRGLIEITAPVSGWLADRRAARGLLTLFIRHTSASLLIQENADPEVQRDLERFFSRLVRDADPMFVHTAEGPDDMPSHVRAALTQASLSIPVDRGAMRLGTWQGIYLYEHRHAPYERQVVLHYVGE
jgi:secondary thiamine-phosphate synthase enzyme